MQLFFKPCLLFHLCTPPLHLCLPCTHTHTNCIILCLSISLSLSLCFLPVSHTVKLSIWPSPSFLVPVSLSLSLNIYWSLALHFPLPFSFYSTTSPFDSPYLSHSGVQLSFIRFFRGKLEKKRPQPVLYLSFFLCFHL